MYKRIKDLREDNDYSQEDIAKMIGCSRSNYAMYESGKVKITVEQLARLADIYFVSVDYLVNLSDVKDEGKNFCSFKKENLISNITNLRIRRNLHQSFLATNVLKCTQAAYSQYENGKRNLNIDILILLAKYYGVSIDFLMGRVVK